MAVVAGETIFKKSNYSENESDIWDDTALIEAYDNAVNDMQKQLSGHGVEIKNNSSLTNQAKDKEKNNQKRKKKKKPKNKSDRKAGPTSVKWKVGAHCRAVYTEDGEIYEAIIKSVDLSNNTAVVRFLGYGNEEAYELDDLLPSEAVMTRRQRRMSQTSDVYSESDASVGGHTWQQQQQRRGSGGSSRGRGMRGPSPVQGLGHPHAAVPPSPPQMAGWGGPPPLHPPPPPPVHPWMGPAGVSPLQSMVGGQPPILPPMFASPDFLSSSFPNPVTVPSVPPPPPAMLDTDDVDKDALHNMLISWYMSGYSTGYYQGLKDGKLKMRTSQSGTSSENKEQEASARKI